MILFLFGISMGEVVLVFLVVLLLFGSKKIPELARGLGKGINEFNKATDEIKREFSASTQEMQRDLYDMKSIIREKANEINRDSPGADSDVDIKDVD